eukprot:10140025-Alexandrium_andersonii.AAC.1
MSGQGLNAPRLDACCSKALGTASQERVASPQIRVSAVTDAEAQAAGSMHDGLDDLELRGRCAKLVREERSRRRVPGGTHWPRSWLTAAQAEG